MRARAWLLAGLVASIMVAGCGSPPRLRWADRDGVRTTALRDIPHGLTASAPGVRTGPWGESPEATFQLLEIAVAEPPHAHDEHDLTIVLLKGSGTLFLGGHPYTMRAGDVTHIAPGVAHHFHPSRSEVCVGLAFFTPRLAGPDRRLVSD